MSESRAYAEEDEHFRSAPFLTRALPSCPKCGSQNTQPRELARRTGCAFGTVAGVAAGVMTAIVTADIPAVPLARALGIVSVAIIGGMAAGSAGSTTGAALGEIVDRNILNNCTCISCGKHFRLAA